MTENQSVDPNLTGSGSTPVDLLTEVRKALAEAAGIPVDSIKDDVPLELLGISSIEVMSAYVWLERILHISFTGSDLRYAPTNTVAEVAAGIESTYAAR